MHGLDDDFVHWPLVKSTYDRLRDDHGFKNLNVSAIEGGKHKLNREMIERAKEFMESVR